MNSEAKPIQIKVTGSEPGAIEIHFADSSEFLRVTRQGAGLYRLDESRAFCFRPSLGDVIQAASRPDGTLQFQKVSKKSGLRQERYLVGRPQLESESFKTLLATVTARGGLWEIVCGGLLILHLPRPVSFAELEASFTTRAN